MELLFTVYAVVLFPGAAVTLMLISPAAGFGVLMLFVVYLSPASAIVNSLAARVYRG
jgi:hypothetical protein